MACVKVTLMIVDEKRTNLGHQYGHAWWGRAVADILELHTVPCEQRQMNKKIGGPTNDYRLFADTQFCKRLCPSVRWFVGPSVMIESKSGKTRVYEALCACVCL